jgi:uncharacterized membrane protein YeaQ/YmgE (transglycosylase-associated protein family)
MNILLWIIFGGLAGAFGSALVESDLTLLGNVVVGIVGAFIGGWISGKVSGKGGGATRPTTLWSFVWAVIGSVVLLILAGLLV